MRSGWVSLLGSILIGGSTALAGPPGSETVVRPEAAPGPLDNPLKGWCPYTNAGPIRQPYSMVFLYASWKDLEPQEGQYAFDRWESTAWSVPEAKGKHVVLRVTIDYPTRPSGLPDWLKAKGVKQTPYDDHGGGLSPDYDDPRMIAALARLIEALGQRYDQNPRVAFLQLGLLGFWGEWHTYPQGQLYASPKTEQLVINAFHKAFPHKILLARTARGDAGKRPWLGFHDDMFPDDTDNGQDWSFLAVIRAAGRSDNWKRSVIGGEMVPCQAKIWLGDRYATTTERIDKAHFSWVGPYCPALETTESPEFRSRSEALVRRMGYQFRLDEIRHPSTVVRGATLPLAIKGLNEGVAPFSYPWPVELALIDEVGKLAGRLPLSADVRTWLPGSFAINGSVKFDVPPGLYKLAIGLRDPWTGQPAVGFANKLPRQEGWTILSSLTIEPKP